MKRNVSSSRFRGKLLVFAQVVLFIVFTGMFYSDFTEVYMLRNEGVEVEGEIHRGYHFPASSWVIYRFEVDGIQHEGEMRKHRKSSWLIYPSRFQETEQFQKANVTYFPDDITINRLSMTLTYTNSILLFVMLLFFPSVGIFLLYSRRKDKQDWLNEFWKDPFNLKEK